MPFQSESSEKAQYPENEIMKYQNTYRLKAYNPFRTDTVDKILKEAVTDKIEDITYDAAECPKLCESIAIDIRKRIKKLNFDRYKIVVSVTIIEKLSQSLETLIGFLWDAERDNYSTFTYESGTFYAHSCVFGLYYE